MSAAMRRPRPNSAVSAQERFAVRDATWDLYVRLADALTEEAGIKAAFDGKHYTKVEASRFLHVRRDEVVRWLIEEDCRNKVAWARRVREWVPIELKPRTSRGT